MSNPLVDKDANISVHNYTDNSPKIDGVPVGVVTEGYGQDADRVSNPFTADPDDTIPYSGWANGINEVGDLSTYATGLRDTVDDLVSFLDGKGWFNPSGLLEVIAGTIGMAADAEGWATDWLGSLTADVTQWLIEHITPLRMILDGLAGNPDAIAGYAKTWQNIATQLDEVGGDFAKTAASGPGHWTGPAHDAYLARAGDMAAALDAMTRTSKCMTAVITGAGALVAGVRSLVEALIAELVRQIPDIVEILVGDEVGGGGGELSAVGTLVAKAIKVVELLLKDLKELEVMVPMIQTIVGAIGQAGQTWAS